mmetsp:Transcript_2459/g.9024  ORF Transcript_2459/g.9024 Transcript_2459/m.9024 type:complete len:440 (+) Transcript_2459:29-1348(+)
MVPSGSTRRPSSPLSEPLVDSAGEMRETAAAGDAGPASSSHNPFASSATKQYFAVPEQQRGYAEFRDEDAELARPKERVGCRRGFRIFLLVLAFFLLVGAVPFCIYELIHSRGFLFVVLTAAAFATLGAVLAFAEMLSHMVTFTSPLQWHVLRILFMVPVYAMCSLASLIEPEVGIYLQTAQECYEAIVIFSFVELIIGLFDRRAAALHFASGGDMLGMKSRIEHLWPVNRFLQPWPMGQAFFRWVRWGSRNYVVLRPATAIAGFVAVPFGLYEHGDMSFDKLYVYFALINTISQGWAVYCLVMLYRATHHEIEDSKPFSKFFCVKAIVFLTWWQGVCIAIGIQAGAIQQLVTPRPGDTPAQLATRVQQFFVSVEMLGAALGYNYAYSSSEFAQEEIQEDSPYGLSLADPGTSQPLPQSGPRAAASGHRSVWDALTHIT